MGTAPGSTPPASEGDVLGLVLRHGSVRPSAPAVQDDKEQLTYGQLAERAASVAAGLAAAGVQPGDRVALHLENSSAFVSVALGCLWLGAAFVPLSPDSPPARTARVVRDCRPAVVVTNDPGRLPPLGPGAEGPVADGPSADGPSADGPSADGPSADGPGATSPGAGRGARQPLAVVAPDDLWASRGPVPARAAGPGRDAYLIYTSGTTGAPKGVTIPERAMWRSVTTTTQLVGLDQATRALAVSAFHFDGSYGLLFPTLAAGGLLVIPKREQILFLRRFYDTVVEQEVNFSSFSPSYLRLVVSSRHLSKLAGSKLRDLLLGGEQCATEDIARLWEVLPEVRVFNRYGPTEATIAVTTYRVKPDDVAAGWVPLGTPHPGVKFFVVTPDGSLAREAGEEGELYIGGEQLMSRYWGDDALTGQVLRQDVVPGETLYKTGDLVFRDGQGRYVYRGRLDDVVKRNGVRISLGEISRALRQAEGVTGAFCALVDIGSPGGGAGIAAFVEAPAGTSPADLLEAAGRELPANALPDEVFIVGSLPITSQGKVDHRRLLADAGREAWHAP